MKWLAVLSLIAWHSQTCNKEGNIKIPSCISEKIEAIKQQPKYNPPATVSRYSYKSQYVYFFSSDCCDQYNYLYDKNCNIICAPSGGITGKGDGKCADFRQEATGETLIWKDPR
jgi:hypothetical protein